MMAKKSGVPERLAGVLPAKICREVVDCLCCGECGEVLWRASEYWTCPNGHGKLIGDLALEQKMFEAMRADKRVVKSRVRCYPKEVMQKLVKFQKFDSAPARQYDS